MISIDSIQTGKVITEGDSNAPDVNEREWTSAFRKTVVDGPVTVDHSGIVGDEAADTQSHRTPDKAILCYSTNHYRAWRTEHPELDFAPGGFGENLTVGGVTEREACIGDRLRAGECEFEISQPRQPCWKISRRWQCKTMTKEVTQSGRTGWYLRILSGGTLVAGTPVEVIQRPNPDWTVARANDVLFGRDANPMSVHALMSLPQLSPEWQAALA